MSFKMLRAIGTLFGKNNKPVKKEKELLASQELTEGTRRPAQINMSALKYPTAKEYWKAEILPYVSSASDKRWENIGVRMQIEAQRRYDEWLQKEATTKND